MIGRFARRLQYEVDFVKAEGLARVQGRGQSSSWSFYQVCFLGLLLTANGVKWIMFGRLTHNEVRNLRDRAFYTGWEFAFGLVLFYFNTTRELADITSELVKYCGLFLCVLLLKCFHFLSADRVSVIFPLSGTFKWAQYRFGAGIFLIAAIDVLLIGRFFHELQNYRSSFDENILAAIFGFEIINIFPLILLTAAKFTGNFVYQEGWASSAMDQPIHIVEFMVNLSRFIMVCTFSVVFLYFYTFPFHIMPSSYMSLRVLVAKTRHLIQLRKKRARLMKLALGSSGGDCTICFDALDMDSRTTPCKHSFHFHCLQEWASYAESCPVCRMAL